jgi:Ca2+:H+ antiporter
VDIAGILFLAYLASLAFTLITHHRLFNAEHEGATQDVKQAGGIGRAILTLAVTATMLAVMSETLTGALEPTSQRLGLTPVFAGIFLLAPVGNCSELLNAVQFARRGKMNLTIAVTYGAATQVALLVAPVLIFASHLMGQPMDLLFSPFEVVAIGIAVLVAQSITMDGESNWLEGVMLLAVYAMLGVGFYNR